MNTAKFLALASACTFAVADGQRQGEVGMDAVAPSEVMEWEDYKEHFAKVYTREEEPIRMRTYLANVDLIKRINAEHDAGTSSVRLGVNHFADMTNQEYREMLTFRMSNVTESNVTILPPAQPGATIDWRTKGAVSPVKNQYRCGGCWSFAAIAAAEGAFKIATGQLRVLSEQQLLDCSNQGGCLGGETPSGLIYIEINKGVDTESEYTWAEGMAPNPPPKFPCWKQAAARHAATIFNHTFVKIGDESQMAAALLISPLATAVDADSNVFQLYKTGVLKAGQGCRPSGAAPNHAVTIVGMTATSYIVKNSWGPGWGDKGYVQVARGTTGPGVCGIALQNVYAKTHKGPAPPIPPPAKGPRPGPPPPPKPPPPAPPGSKYTTITSGTCKSHGYEVVGQDDCVHKAAKGIARPWGGTFACSQGCPGGCVEDTVSCASCVAYYIPGDPHQSCDGQIKCVCRKP